MGDSLLGTLMRRAWHSVAHQQRASAQVIVEPEQPSAWRGVNSAITHTRGSPRYPPGSITQRMMSLSSTKTWAAAPSIERNTR